MSASLHSSAQLSCRTLSFSYGPRAILREIDLTVGPRDCIGIVGANGTGKTTLLRLLAGELAVDEGVVSTNPMSATVGLLHQQLADEPGESVGDFITRMTGLGAIVTEFEAALADVAVEAPGADQRYDQALERYLLTDAATIEQRTQQTLEEVGLGGLDLGRRTDELSGGQRTKVNLAAMLLAAFDVLLLDEPTNDLDVEGLALLEQMMADRSGATVVVSHDRAFLERVITSVFELDDHFHTGSRFNGGFEAWQEARAIARQQEYDAYAEYNEKRTQLQKRVQTQHQWSVVGVHKAKSDTSERDKFIRAARIESSEKVAGKAKQTERALERLERTEKVEAPWEPWELQLTFQAAERSGREVAVLNGATVERGDFRLGPIDVVVSAGDRIMITGENGSGKSTLLHALFAELALTSGTQGLGPSVKVATLRQGRELFTQASSLLRGFTDAVGCDDQDARSQLAKLGLDTERIGRPVNELSPGEQTRASLGLFAALGSNVLVLDEPTNHLDLPAIEQLEAAIAVFPHTVLLVTHDRRLIENVTTNRHWHIENGALTEM